MLSDLCCPTAMLPDLCRRVELCLLAVRLLPPFYLTSAACCVNTTVMLLCVNICGGEMLNDLCPEPMSPARHAAPPFCIYDDLP
ncbi:hypothetical protein SAMD00019534_126300 [Acytostelium subglobosum LB1]|uniref:hypothetical protein n=1 Tax=Acytostelium subglobosum LB1 TaxID=1410327 RepID=UPI000644C0D7|nr:hypothetical protein SAMD00019534_126300 [Acytostelium subglobosum LB1]GAM29454.1 hypothetical protein SAMD00019534_126300 [Acytostelium subglobosum LB1]|eukprot:XP_012747599.1 hypothetical protein SAMD00019534_126300 [Acytostelium subglobosum LB1]